MSNAYATVSQLREHWAGLLVEDEVEAAQKLREASIEVRGSFRGLDQRIEAGTLDPDAVVLVVCRMVKRAMDTDDEDGDGPGGMETFQFGVGPFQMSGKPTNPDGNVYLSKADKRLLFGPRRAFSTMPGRS